MARFFRKEFERGGFNFIAGSLRDNILPKYPLKKGHDLLKIIFAIRICLNWITIFPDTFRETLNELHEDTRKSVLFQFKVEIEEYYRQYYLVNEFEMIELNVGEVRNDYHKISIPENEWERIRLQNIGDCSKITIPGYCSRCNSVSIFAVDSLRYLDWIIAAHQAHPQWNVYGKCDKCGRDYGASAHVMRLPHFSAAWL